jgi:hypothetical protein
MCADEARDVRSVVPVGSGDRGEQGEAGDAVEAAWVGLEDHDIVFRSGRQDQARRVIAQRNQPGGQPFSQRGELAALCQLAAMSK